MGKNHPMRDGKLGRLWDVNLKSPNFLRDYFLRDFSDDLRVLEWLEFVNKNKVLVTLQGGPKNLKVTNHVAHWYMVLTSCRML